MAKHNDNILASSARKVIVTFHSSFPNTSFSLITDTLLNTQLLYVSAEYFAQIHCVLKSGLPLACKLVYSNRNISQKL